MQQPLKATHNGPYVRTDEGLDRAKQLSREELRKELERLEEDDKLGRNSTATGSPTDELE